MDKPSTSGLPPTDNTDDPFVRYTRSLHDYTLRLWAETRRLAVLKNGDNEDGVQTPQPTSRAPQKVGAEGETMETTETSPNQSDRSSDSNPT